MMTEICTIEGGQKDVSSPEGTIFKITITILRVISGLLWVSQNANWYLNFSGIFMRGSTHSLPASSHQPVTYPNISSYIQVTT